MGFAHTWGLVKFSFDEECLFGCIRVLVTIAIWQYLHFGDIFGFGDICVLVTFQVSVKFVSYSYLPFANICILPIVFLGQHLPFANIWVLARFVF